MITVTDGASEKKKGIFFWVELKKKGFVSFKLYIIQNTQILKNWCWEYATDSHHFGKSKGDGYNPFQSYYGKMACPTF